MVYHYTVEIGKESFDLAYSPGINEVLISHQPRGRRSYNSFEKLDAQGGQIYFEMGPSDKAGNIRAAFPQLRKADLPSCLKKDLRKIDLRKVML